MWKLITAIGLILASASQASAADKPGCADSTLVKRFEDAALVDCAAALREDAGVVTKPFSQSAAREDLVQVTGAVETRIYANPTDRSAAEVNRYYEAVLLAGGAQILFSCTREACSADGRTAALVADRIGRLKGDFVPKMLATPEDMRYAAIKLKTKNGDAYVWVISVYSAQDRRAYSVLQTIVPPALHAGPALVSAGELMTGIGVDGHVPLYSLLFENGKAGLLPDSTPQIDEIVRLLKGDPEMKILIACHNDGQSADATGIELSRRRAEAVRDALVKAGIGADRLSAQGVGAAAPIASNRDEAGRARNRRVEIVERLN